MCYFEPKIDREELCPFHPSFFISCDMKLHLNLSLRRALMAAMSVVATLASSSFAGMVDSRYDLQYYMDFARNKGMFSAGATNISVYYKDGTAVTNPVIPIMPNLDSYGKKTGAGNGGCALVNPQFVVGAAHVGSNPVYFLSENGSTSTCYTSAGYKSYATDVDVQRLNKIVTEVAYTPMADDSFMQTLSAGAWLWRLGDGMQYNSDGEIVASLTGSNTLGGIVGVNSISKWANGTWVIVSNCRESDVSGDLRTPLDIGHMYGDSGSPHYAWDAVNNRFVYVAACSNGSTNAGYNNSAALHSNPSAVQAGIDLFTVAASVFSGTETILWNTQDAATGKGTLTQGDVSVEYTGLGTGNTLNDTLGLAFSTTDTENVQTLELQGSVDMGAGAVTFDSGKWKLTEKEATSTFNSAGFVVNSGAELSLELTGTASEEWRKVGEGTLTIAGSGNNDAVLRVGGGETQYEITYDESGNITGCTLGNIGETRLNRTDGYAASSVRLEAGVAIVVLMADNQFKTNSVAGDTFTFGNNGGLLNLNGHDLTWGVINQDGSGTGARIGNKTPLGETAPGNASFTYTGTGTFAGCFVDEGTNSTAQLAVVYNNAEENATWTLTGNHSNVGGFTVEDGTMVLQGSNTPHVRMTDSGDWTYATLEGSDVTVKSGATFQLSHHALMTGNVIVEDGGAFILNQTVNAASESVGGSLRQDMAALGITSLRGNVTLAGNATMTANTESPVTTTIQGNITSTNTDSEAAQFTKQGSGILVVNGQLNVPAGTVEAGGLVIKDATENNWQEWTIGEQGFLAVEGLDNSTLLSRIDTSSSGVLALSQDQETQLELSGYQNLIIGAWGNVSYGTNDVSLTTVNDETYGAVWRLGGGTGTLTVNFKLTGDADLLIGNEWSSGTVHLANAANDFSGDIYILGTGNKLSYADGALGSARVNLTYGNALALNDPAQLDIIKDGSSGVLALATDENLDLSGTTLSLGANGAFTYTGSLTVDEKYRFGGSGQLTVDTDLDGTKDLEIDGQGTTGSSVIFARENAFTGSIIAGGGLALDEANSSGDVGIRVGHASALAAAASVTLQKGSVLYTDGNSLTVNNLSMESGSALRNNGSTNSLVLLNVTEGTDTSLADGVLNSNADSAALHLVKSGQGTLTMGANANWSGGLTIAEGTVKATITSTGDHTSSGGIGSSSNVIYVAEGATLSLSGGNKQGYKLGGTTLVQTVNGTGTIEFSTGGAALFSEQSSSFDGTIKLMGNTRLYVGTNLTTDSFASYNNTKNAVNNATIDIESGSQVRIGSGLRYLKAVRVSLNTDFVISGTGFSGSDWGLVQSSCNAGALSIDGDSTVYGNITLKDDACIASWSAGTLLTSVTNWTPCTSGSTDASYALKGYLGGTVRGKILGEGKTLTISGNEGMTFTADSENTYGDLVIANGNGNNDDKFALRLNGGSARSQVSTALGTGNVTLKDGLILRLAGTGTADMSDVVYTYANNIAAGAGATLQSYNITNKLTGTVSMSGNSLNLATANGGVLELAGGISGSGTLNVGANSVIILGSDAETLSRSTTPQFSGSVVAAAGADITLASSAVVSDTTAFSGTDSLTLRFGGADDYTLDGITMSASDGCTSLLTLNFDFTNVPDAADATTWATLFSDISAGETTIELSLNMFNDIEQGTYTLATGSFSGSFELADTLNDRLALVQQDGSLILTVDADNRLYWSASAANQSWNTSDLNWYQQSSAGNVAFTANAHVVLDDSGAVGSSAESREAITLATDQTVGTLVAKDENTYYEVTGEASLSGDKLAVGEKADLKLSTASASFTNGVQVDDATLEVSETNLTAAVSVANGADFALSNGATLNGNLDIADAEAIVRGATVQGNLSLSGTAQVQMEAAQISGTVTSVGGTMTLSSAQLTGNLSNGENSLNSTSLTILGGSVTSDATLRMDSLRLQDGSLQINAAADIGTLGIAAGKTVTLWNATSSAGADKIIGTAELANSAVLVTNDRETVTAATRIGTVKLTGESATIRDTHHSGFFEIHNLEGSASSTLNLVKNVTSNNVGVYALGDAVGTTESGSQFAGTILVKQQNASSDGSRDVVLLLNHESVAQNATIHLASAAQATPKVALGINVESATIGGLSSGSDLASRAVVFSGAQASNSGWVDHSKDSAHTLIIDTASGSTHEFYGQVQNVNLVIDGEGTQKFLGSGENFTGSLSIQGGTAAFNASSFSMLNNASSLVVGSGTLDVSAIDFADDANVIRVNDGCSISFADNSIVAFGNMYADTEYGVFDISDGVLEGWSGLSASNFTIDGVKLSDMGRVVLNLDMAGGFSYTIEDGWDLVWNGGAEKQIWNQNESNQVWQTTRPDDYTDESVEMTVGYKNNDNVEFNSDADLELEGNICVNNLTVAEGVSLKTNGNLTITGALNVGSNVSWSFSGDTSLSFTETQLKSFTAIEVGEGATLTMTDKVTEKNNTSDAFNSVSGAGNVVLNLSADNGVGFNFEKITGDITVATGRLQVNTSMFNAASGIYLATADSQLVFNGQGTELKNDVVLEATTTIHANNQCSGAISGVISGSSGLTKVGAGALTFKQQNTYTGTTTISGGKIILDTAGAYRLLNNISGGTLEVASGTTLANNDMAVSSALVLTEGAAAEVSGSRKLKENITVNSGATLTFTGSGSDTLEYGDQAQYSKKLTVDGGVVDFGNTRQTMAKWDITLKNGASLRGVGGSYNYGTNTTIAAMDFNQDVVIKAESGDNTISATTRLRGGNSRTLTYNVSEGATLDVSGRIFGDNDTSPAGNVTKSGAGKATLSARTMLNKVTTVGGEIAVAYTGSDGNTIGILDGSSDGTAAGSLRLKKDALLNVSSQLWGRSQSSVVLEQDAVLSHGSVQFTNKGTSDATLKTSGNNSQYSVAASDWSLTNGHLASSSDSEVTLGTQLVNSSVENAGSGQLTVSNSANSITDVYATAGNIDIEQLNAAVNLNLSELTVAESKTVGLYSGSDASRVEANVTVTSHAKFGSGAVLNANLTLASGSTLSVAEGGLAMGSTLTLQKGLTLDDTTLGRVHALSVGESTALFTGVDGLTLDKTTYTSLTENDSMLANPYFTNLNSGNQYVLTYSGTDNGTLSIMAASVPEPTTTTLSLLALSALAMRRRRK